MAFNDVLTYINNYKVNNINIFYYYEFEIL